MVAPPTVTTNTFESEALQFSTTGKNVLKLRHYQEHDFGILDAPPFLVRVDNEATLEMLLSPAMLGT